MNNSYILNQFSQIICHFYRQIISKHPNKLQLIGKLNKMMLLVSRQQPITNRTSDISPQKQPSSRYINTSRQKTVSQNVPLNTLENGKEWGCEWYLVRSQLSKILVYVIMHSLISAQNFWEFQRIREEINQKISKNSLGENTIFKFGLQLQKISKLFFNNKKEGWQHFLVEILKKLPKQANTFILQSYALFEVDNAGDDKLTDYLKELALKFRIKIHYFQLDCQRIVVNKRYGLGEVQYNIGYVGSMEKYTLANKFPVLSESRAKKMQTLQHFQMNIDELIKQYEQNSTKLNQIQGIKNYVSVENKIKEFINTKK